MIEFKSENKKMPKNLVPNALLNTSKLSHITSHASYLWIPYLASGKVIVSVLDSSFLDNAPALPELLSMKKPGCLGWGRIASSFVNIDSTQEIIGLSSTNFWTHSKPTWIHLSTWDLKRESSKHVYDSSKALSSFHSNHA